MMSRYTGRKFLLNKRVKRNRLATLHDKEAQEMILGIVARDEAQDPREILPGNGAIWPK